MRYSGAPLPLALDEGSYPHQIVQVELAAGAPVRIEPIRVPRSVEVLRVPAGGPAPLEAVLAALQALDLDASRAPARWPYLEVRVRLDRPEPGLRRQVEGALEGRPVRLLKIATTYPGTGARAPVAPPGGLQEITPDEVFRLRYRQRHGGEPPPALLDAYHALLEQVQGGEA